MTWIDQALHWWANAAGEQVPPRHYETLRKHGFACIDSYGGHVTLTDMGRSEMRRLGYVEEWPGSNTWTRADRPAEEPDPIDDEDRLPPGSVLADRHYQEGEG